MLALRRLWIGVIFLSLCVSYNSHANFDNALKLYNAGDFPEAKLAFEALAAIGDRSSLFNLGVMHYRGEAFDSDPVKAYVLMAIANDGFDDPDFARTAAAVHGKLDNEQKIAAQKLLTELKPIYGIDNIMANILPKPLDDADCAPDIEPIKLGNALYPVSESNSSRMGITHLEFTISPEGYPRDIVAENSTSKQFTKTTVKGFKKSLFKPTLDRRPIYGQRINYAFHMTQLGGKAISVKTQRVEKELEELKSQAENGDAIAQYQYASRLITYQRFKPYLKNIEVQYKSANEWFTKSAEKGLPHAQFEVGRNMIEGKGCEIDVESGLKWIKAAAIGGYSPAQNTIARSALSVEENNLDRSLAAIGWLRNSAQSGNYAAKVLLAWELSTSTVEQLRDGKEALALIDADPENYFDKIRIMETKAAAYAELGNFKKAVKYQKKAKNLAERKDWEIPLISERLGLYDHGQAYRGSYY